MRELRSLLTHAAKSSDDDETEPTQTLTVSATREDGWLFECARKAAEAVTGPLSSDRLIQNLLAEGYSTLLELAPDCSALFELDELENHTAAESQAHAAWCAERERWRSEAEKLCEIRRSAATFDAPESCAAAGSVYSSLGERLGVSVSSLKAKRILASRAARVPELATALSAGRIGYEAAYLLSRVVTPSTANEWIARAERRTVKHLREEVDAAELLIRNGQSREQRPLDEESLDALFELERSIVSGYWVGRDRDSPAGDAAQSETPGPGQISGAVAPGNGGKREWRGASKMSGAGSPSDGAKRECHGASQMSGERLGARLAQRFGRVMLRIRVTATTHRFWRALERVFIRLSARVRRTRTSFLRFLCENFCRIWLPALRHGRLTESGELPEYFAVYRRDAFRCKSPVCTRRDVTPHHLVFRSHGGDDAQDNVASLCVWCHLSGIHEGRIAAEPPASKIRWRIGRGGTLRVEGRTVSAR